jgi:hypothetical protein
LKQILSRGNIQLSKLITFAVLDEDGWMPLDNSTLLMGLPLKLSAVQGIGNDHKIFGLGLFDAVSHR